LKILLPCEKYLNLKMKGKSLLEEVFRGWVGVVEESGNT
jgi:hypothetical protein